jgi:hypothetical protein
MAFAEASYLLSVLTSAAGVLTPLDALASGLPGDMALQKWLLLAGLAAPAVVLAAFGGLLQTSEPPARRPARHILCQKPLRRGSPQNVRS